MGAEGNRQKFALVKETSVDFSLIVIPMHATFNRFVYSWNEAKDIIKNLIISNNSAATDDCETLSDDIEEDIEIGVFTVYYCEVQDKDKVTMRAFRSYAFMVYMIPIPETHYICDSSIKDKNLWQPIDRDNIKIPLEDMSA